MMDRRNLLLKIVCQLLICVIIRGQISPSDESLVLVYRTFPDLIINEYTSQSSMNKIITNGQVNLVYIQDEGGNITIVDSTSDNKVLSIISTSACISGFIVSRDGTCIICYTKQKFVSYRIVDTKRGVIEQLYVYELNQTNTNRQIDIIQIQIDISEQYVFMLTTDGIITLFYSFNTPYTHFILIQQFQYALASLIGFKISYNNNYILIDQAYQGLHILKLYWDVSTTAMPKVDFYLAASFLSQTCNDSYIFKDESTIIALDNWGGIQIASIQVLQIADASLYPLQLQYQLEQWWEFDDPMPYCLTVDEEKKILFVGGRSQGIFIIDIHDLNKPVVIQNIALSSYAMSISLSQDMRYIYYTNREQFFVFSQTQPYFQDTYFHFFNTHQSNLTQVPQTKWLWRCYVNQQDNVLFSASDVHGVQIYDLKDGPNEMSVVFSIDSNSSYLQIDDLIFLGNEQQFMVIPIRSAIESFAFSVIDISEIDRIQVVSHVEYNKLRQVQGMGKTSDDRYIVATYEQSIIILDCFDYLLDQQNKLSKQILVVGEYEFFEVNKDISSDATFIKNNAYIIVCFSYYGFVLLQFTPSPLYGGAVALNIIEIFQTYGGESIKVSLINPDIAFISDGLNGVQIISFASLPDKIQVIVRLQLSGWVNQITLINGEQQMVTSSIDGGYLTLVDIADLYAPFIVTEFSFREKYYFSSCMSHNKEYFFINTEKGIRTFIMKQQSLIHTDIALYNPDKDLYVQISRNEPFKIGQSIAINFHIIYPINGQKISNIFYYQNREKVELPSDWMYFDNESNQLTIQVNKDGLNYSLQTKKSQNIIVVQSTFSLNQDSFIYNSTANNNNINAQFLTTTAQDSSLIYDCLIKTGYINWKTGIVNPDLIQDNLVYFDISGVQTSERLFKAVTHTLQQSCTFNPIYFDIESSLNFDINSVSQTFVSSLSTSISITISFYTFSDKNNPDSELIDDNFIGIPGGIVFMDQIQALTTGLSLTLSKDGTILNIEGTQTKINEFLQEKIVYWYQNPSEDQKQQMNLTIPDQIFVVFLIQDLINYDMQKTYALIDVPFLKLKAGIKEKVAINEIEKNTYIQREFNKLYENGIVSITDDIDIQFQRDQFYDPDMLEISFYATLLDQQEIPPDYWLQFQPSTMRLYGTVPTSLFREVIRLRIVAYNNYTKYWNELNIYVNEVPFLYVLEILAKIVSPLLFLIGLYRFKYILYNAFLRHRNRYSSEICYINQPYVKKIPLIGKDLQIAKFLVDALKSIALLEQSEIRKQDRINTKKMTQHKIPPILTITDIQVQVTNNQSNTQIPSKKLIPSSPFNLSRGLINSINSSLQIRQRKGSLFRIEHIKNFNSKKMKDTVIENISQIEKLNMNQTEGMENNNQLRIFQNKKKSTINNQAKSLPNIPDEDISNQIQQREELILHSRLNEFVHSSNVLQNEKNQHRNSISLNTNNNLPKESPTINQLKSKFNINLKAKEDILSNNHLNYPQTNIKNKEKNPYNKRYTLDYVNHDYLKGDSSFSLKKSNENIVQDSSKQQGVQELIEPRRSSVIKQDVNKIVNNKRMGGLLTPQTEYSYNLCQDNSNKSPYPIKRQMNISPKSQGFKRQLSILKQMHKKSQKIYKQRSIFEIKYMLENGRINMENVISDIIQQNTSFVYQMKKYHASDFLLELKNKDSILYNYIRSLTARYLLSLDRQSTLIYNILKQYAQDNFSFTMNDWYRAYVDIQAQQESDMHGFQISFPRLSMNQKSINRVMHFILFFEPNQFDEQSLHDEEFSSTPHSATKRRNQNIQNSQISQQNQHNLSSNQLNVNSRTNTIQGFNQPLIEEVILADTLGLIIKSPSIKFPSSGESLHIRGYQVDSVEAFSIQKRENNYCSKIREIFGLDYHRYGSSQNIKLPSWMNFYQKQNLIFLEGTPSSHDIEEVLIRIYNSQRYIIKEFILKITNEFNFKSNSEEEAEQNESKEAESKQSNEEEIKDSKEIINSANRITIGKPISILENTKLQQSNYTDKNVPIQINNQFNACKSNTCINQVNNDPLSSPSSFSQISITSQNRFQLLSEDQDKYTLEQTSHRIPQNSDTYRFIQDINPLSTYTAPQFQGLKSLYEARETVKTYKHF